MSYRETLPQQLDDVLLTDSGIETDLIFHGGFDLPEFASFVLVDDPRGMAALQAYYRAHLDIASEHGCGLILEAPTWRASRDWLARIGYPTDELARVNRAAVALLSRLRTDYLEARGANPIVISGCVGPRGDAYRPASVMSEREAEDYHGEQITLLATTECDMIHAMTLTYTAEAIGIARAAVHAGIPVAISFTTEIDGHLPDGTSLTDAVVSVDHATDRAPVYYGVNCAHPSHFQAELPDGETGLRLRSVRANASAMSHAELDAAAQLDDGDPLALAADYAQLRAHHPSLSIFGGCCGTDARHVRATANVLLRGR